MAEKPKLLEKTKNEIDKMQLDVSQVTRTKSIFNPNQIQKLWNSTNRKRFVYDRPARGGGKWDYVKVSYVRKVLDSVFGFDWDFEVETTLAEAFEVAKITKVCTVKGTLTGRVMVDGVARAIKRTQWGRHEIQFLKEPELGSNGQPLYETKNGKRVVKMKPSNEPLDFGNDMKAATSDCLKKCASLMGVASDIYEPEEFMEIEIIGSQENTDRQKQIKKMVKKAEKELKKK